VKLSKQSREDSGFEMLEELEAMTVTEALSCIVTSRVRLLE
jgi:hypothetical protein